MDRSLFSKTKFVLTKLPEWICPTCKAGTLRKVQDDDFRILRNATTQYITNEPFFDHDHDICVFTGRLLCGNCLENVFVSGVSSTEIDYDEHTGTDYYAVVEPHFFIPTLRLIDVDERVPTGVLIVCISPIAARPASSSCFSTRSIASRPPSFPWNLP